MYKIFQGFNIISAIHNSRKKNYLKTVITLAIALVFGFAAWFVPADFYGIPNLSIIEQRVIAIFVFATLMWMMEVVPAWTTSVLIITLLLLTISDSGVSFLLNHDTEALGKVISYKSLLFTFADPTIMLFLGGFILAIAATKTGLDAYLARVLLKPFGTQSKFVLLGFLLVTGVFSMFISNTATAAMMLTFLSPVLKALPVDGKGRVALTLSIPIGANIGGIGTPIGTPPNAIALKYLNDPAGLNMNIGFGEWVSVMLPFVILLLFIAWFLLLKLFPFKQKTINLDIKGNLQRGPRPVIVYVTFAVTILLWMLDKLTGINANVVAMIPIAVFCVTGVIDRCDLEEINWSVLWMVAGGFALGVALNDTGLAKHMVSSIPFASWSPMLVIIGSGLICWIMSNFISNTATAALMVPILCAIGVGMGDSLTAIGGVRTLLIGIAMSASMAMLLPISTPPNAIAHSTGLVRQKDMVKMGLIIGVLGMILGYTLLIFIGKLGIL